MRLIRGRREIPKEEWEVLLDHISGEIKKAGMEPGDVLICSSPSQIGILAEWMSCCRTGVVPLFVGPEYPVETSDFLKYSDVSRKLSVDKEMRVTLSSFEKGSGPHLSLSPGSVIHMTSATSGNPKFIVRTKEMLDLELQRYCDRLALTSRDVFLSMAPFYHAYAFLCPCLGCLYTDGTLVEPDLNLPRNLLELCRENQVTVVFGVPFLYDSMADVGGPFGFYEGTRYIISSGEKLTEKTAKKFRERFGISLRQQYGSTETGTITFSGPDEPFESQGRPIEGVVFSFPEKDGKHFAAVDTRGTMGSYIREQVEPIAPDGVYVTSDLGYLDEEGRLFIEGRGDDVVIRAGEKINLKLVAKALEQIPGVEKAKVTADDSERKELTCFYSGEEASDEFLRREAKRYLSLHEIPQHFVHTADDVGQKENWKHKE